MNEQQEQAVEFFHEHAGWGYDPAKETPEQGRRKGAELLAKAEQWARSENVTIGWEDDWSIGSHVNEFETYEQEPETCETATAYGPAGEVLASLSCIDDADTNYRRVIAAELALEAMTAEPTKPQQPTEEQGYNGWKNYETWNVALWIDNDEGSYHYSRELVKEAADECETHEGGIRLGTDDYCNEAPDDDEKLAGDPGPAPCKFGPLHAAADALKDWQEQAMPELEASVWSDLLSAAFSEVDWFEIAEHYLGEES